MALEDDNRRLGDARRGPEADADRERLVQALRQAEEEIAGLKAQLLAAQQPPAPMHRIMSRPQDFATRAFPSLADFCQGRDATPRALKVCILTRDIFGPIRNGGIGTAWGFAADFLAGQGHKVTIAYVLGDHCENGQIADWVAHYESRGIAFEPMPEPRIPGAAGMLSPALKLARRAYEHLKERDFDLVHVSEWSGDGFLCLLAKKLGLAFRDTLFCVKTSSPMLWNMQGNDMAITDPRQMVQAYIERKSVEYADLVISPSLHMLRWMLEYGYKLPEGRCHVQPNIMPALGGGVGPDAPLTRLERVEEIVFFGRLEPRKGLEVFCRAVSLLVQEGRLRAKVTFLGKHVNRFHSQAFLAERIEEWGIPCELITDRNAKQAQEYLSTGNRLAVAPSMLDNSPFTIYECLAARTPFLTTNRGGMVELVRAEDHAEVIFEPKPRVLADLLARCQEEGAVIARPSFDFEQNLETWGRFHHCLANHREELLAGLRPRPAAGCETPLVSVCIAHYNRPHLLPKALESIKAQTYANYEVIVVDDGSTLPEAHACLDSLEPEFAERGWRIVRQENKYLGAVRNTGARHARGEYLLFMDDDNLAKPHELATFVQIARQSGADILTCGSDAFDDEEQIRSGQGLRRINFLGDSMSLGLLVNCFGDSNCFVKRQSFEAIGGFTEDYGVGHDDQEFFARAVLSGLTLYAVPEALYWYRKSGLKMKAKHLNKDGQSGLLRVFRPYFRDVPLCVHEALRFAIGAKAAPGRKVKSPAKKRSGLIQRLLGWLD